MRAHLRYLRVVLRHKWYVFLAGRRLQVPLWQLIIHDWTKFTRAEWPAYVDRFARGMGGQLDKSKDSQGFKDAWKHHWQHNPHHWEYWTKLPGSAYKDIHGVTQMPDHFLREMVADWTAASRVYAGKNTAVDWYLEHHAKILLHPQSRVNAEFLMGLQRCEHCKMLEPQCYCDLAEALGWDPRTQIA